MSYFLGEAWQETAAYEKNTVTDIRNLTVDTKKIATCNETELLFFFMSAQSHLGSAHWENRSQIQSGKGDTRAGRELAFLKWLVE